MPTKSNQPGRETPTSDKTIATAAKEAAGNLTAQRFAATGQTTRIEGHLSAHNKQTQGKRDSR